VGVLQQIQLAFGVRAIVNSWAAGATSPRRKQVRGEKQVCHFGGMLPISKKPRT
jgi:hypothetical protein